MKKKLLLVLVSLALVGCAPGTPASTSSTVPSGDDSQGVSSEQIESDVTSSEDTSLPPSGDMKQTTTVRFHYARNNGKYTNWGLWVWQKKPRDDKGHFYSFDGEDEYGKYVDIDLSKNRLDGSNTIGFIVKQHEPGVDLETFSPGEKDIGSDRLVQIDKLSKNGIQEIYLYEGVKDIMTSLEQALKDKIVTSDFQDKKTIDTVVVLSADVKAITKEMFHLYENGREVELASFTYKDKKITAKLPKEADIKNVYEVAIDFPSGVLKVNCGITTFYDDPDFINNYSYFGDDLGVSFNKDHSTTTFKLWAPISSKVVLNLYKTGTSTEYLPSIRKHNVEETPTDFATRRIEMVKGPQGVWQLTLPGNFHGTYYTYSVTNGSITNEVVDPYAKSCGIDGNRGLVVDFDKINEEVGWDQVVRPMNTPSPTDATVYEAHVRDLTVDASSGVEESKRGTFAGLALDNTSYNGVKTGLAHIKELGVSHVQLQPFFDYASVDEAEKTKYNWGYDPENYNCLEGSYSTNPYDGLVRVKEMKEMVKAFSANDININMDVVYNHTFTGPGSNLDMIIPGYYHRLSSSGTFLDGSGCGNEIASERTMVRKFIVDSCKFWVGEYKLSGFRFDLMELLDTTTMELVYTECKKLCPQVMVYGEPWKGGTSSDSYVGSNKATIQGIKGVGAFNDSFRNAVRGDNNLSQGWVQGGDYSNAISLGIKGQFSLTENNPLKTMNYVSCHDNYALFDQIDRTGTNASLEIEDVVNQIEQAQSLVFLSEGIPFIHGGEEFLRTKSEGDGLEIHNSYNAGDKVNKFDYNLVSQNQDTFDFIKRIIQIRNHFEGFRLDNLPAIEQAVHFESETSVLQYRVEHGGQTYRVIMNTGSDLYSTDDGGLHLIATNGAKLEGGQVKVARGQVAVLSTEDLK